MRSLVRTATIVGVSVILLGVSVPVCSQEQGAKPAVRAQSAMASSGHPLVTRAMVDVLKNGGNALDAAMTGAVMQTVIEPQMVTLAGALSLLYYDAKSGTYYYLDAELNHTRKGAPVSAGWVPMTLDPPQIENTSGRTIAVPGMVAGLKAATERFGTLKWAEYIFAPAIAVAEQGFPMYSTLYGEMADAALGRLAVYPSGRAEFLPKGYVPPVGTLVTRPNLARTMRRLAADGPEYFYKGEWAQHFVTAARETASEITLDDLGAYQPRWEEPVRSTYRDFEIIGAPPPSTAGTLISMILNIVEPWDLKAQPHYSESADTFFRIRRAFAFAEDLTDGYVQDPQSFDVPVKTLLSKDFARSLTALIDGSGPKARAAGTPPPAAERLAGRVEEMKDPHSTDTDQIVVVDKDGNMISVTHSVCGPTFGTGLVVDGVVVNGGNGFPGKAIGGGVRVVSPFDPTMVAKGGKPVLTIGSPGLSSRAVTLALINYLGYGMTLEQAADAPRWQGAQSYKPVTVEARVSEQARRELSTRYGVSVRTTTPYNWHFGSIHAIARQPDGTLLGVADPRRGGQAAGY